MIYNVNLENNYYLVKIMNVKLASMPPFSTKLFREKKWLMENYINFYRYNTNRSNLRKIKLIPGGKVLLVGDGIAYGGSRQHRF